MPVSGLPNNLFRSLRARINQYESTTGRKIGQQTIQALLEAELATAAERSSQDARLELQKSTTERDFGLREKAMGQEADQFAQNLSLRGDELKAQKSAAKMGGAVQLASTAIQGGILYKMLTKGDKTGDPASTSSWLKDAISKLRGGEQSGAVGSPPETAPAFGGGEAAGSLAQSAAMSIPEYAPGVLQASVAELSAGTAGPTYSLGTQAGATSPYSLTGVSYNPPAMEAAAFETGAEGATAAEAASGGFMATAGPAVGSYAGHKISSELVDRDIAPQIVGNDFAGGLGHEINTLAAIPTTIALAPIKIIQAITGGGGSIICTELQRQGYLPKYVVILDGEHRLRHIDAATYRGYVRWAKHVVWTMQRSRIVTWLVAPVGRAWAYEMAHRVAPGIPGSLFGRALMKIGVPICRYLGKRGK